MSVQRAQYEITSSEFIEWNAYLDEKEKTPNRQDILLANIALENRRGFIKNPGSAKLIDFLQVFDMKESPKQTWKEKAKAAKGFFGSLISAYSSKRK
jgi:hypothetical protein